MNIIEAGIGETAYNLDCDEKMLDKLLQINIYKSVYFIQVCITYQKIYDEG
jgi:hypothetical protein